jgi:RimJ/RimL family protein N-acetyltransferase
MSNEDRYFLRTSRLGFRTWSQDDLVIAAELWGDYEVTKFFDARGKWSLDEVQERLKSEIMTENKYGVQYWPIFLLESNEHIGCCGLRPYDLSKGVYEIGFHIRSSQWRQGYAREAAVAVIEYAFSALKAKSIFAGHNPNNTASRQLLEQIGFRYTHDEYYPPTGLNHPSYLLVSDDWAGGN